MGIVKRNSITITLLSYVGVAIGFINKILLFPNFLTEEQVGLTTLLTSVALMYAQFSALGINSTVIRFFPFFRTRGSNTHNGLFAWSVLGISVGFILFTLLLLFFKEPIRTYYSVESPLFSQYYLLLIPLGLTTLFYNFFNGWLQALHKTVVPSFVYDVLLRLLITVQISLFALDFVNFEQFVIGYVLIHFVPTLILLVYAIAIGAVSLRIDTSPRVVRLLKISGVYGLWQFLGGASMYVTPVVDQVMLAGIKGLAAGGVFAIMQHVVSVIMIPYRSIVKVSTPIVAGLWKDRKMDEMQKLYRDASLMNLIIGSFFFVIIWINLDNLFALMPPSYAEGRYVFLFLGLGRVFDMYAGLNGVILVTSKKYRYDLAFSVLLVVLTIATNAWLIPIRGMLGAAVATMITTLVCNLIRIIAVWRFFRIQPFAWVDLGIVGLSAALIGVSMLIPTIGNFISDALVRSSVIALLFAAVVYRSGIAPQLNGMADKTLRQMRLMK